MAETNYCFWWHWRLTCLIDISLANMPAAEQAVRGAAAKHI